MKKLSSKGAQFVPIVMFVVCRKRNRQAQHMCCYSKVQLFGVYQICFNCLKNIFIATRIK